MDLTTSFEATVPPPVRERYDLVEVRNAAAVLAATNPTEFTEILAILDSFRLLPGDVTESGGNKSDVAARLDSEFRKLGWREGRHDVRVESQLHLMPYPPAGEHAPVVRSHAVVSEGYRVDNVKNRVALDVEWNAKDGNLDRDLAAYRALYDAGIIDAGVIVTRTHDDLRSWAVELDVDSTKFGTTTTTNLQKLVPRLTRGDAGGCPLLAVAISRRTSAGGRDRADPESAHPRLWS